MAKTVTATAVKRIITQGLTGWEAGKLVLQDMVDTYLGRDSILAESDVAALRQAPMESADIRDYNMFMVLCRGFHTGYMLAEWACKDACLQIIFLDHALQDADKRRTVELFESFGPRVVTRRQYEDIVAAQLRDRLDTAEQNIRLFLAVKAVLDAAADAVELEVPADKGVLIGPNTRLGVFIALYNLRLEDLKEERKSWEPSASRLEKALKLLPAIDPEKLRPSPDSLKQLKSKILEDSRGEEWLRTKVQSLVCADGVTLKDLLNG